MASAVKTRVTELPESRVRVEAEVSATEVERRVQDAASVLGREMRVPGFRRGKVPPPLVLRRIGRPAVLDEAVRKSLGAWYVDAIDAARVSPVGDPQLDLGELPDEGQPLTFSIEIGVRPAATLGEYRGLEVGRREPTVSEEAMERELDALRDRLARLESAERPAREGDFVVLDYVGSIDGVPFEGGEGRDQLVELGAGRLIPGFEEQLTGAGAGDERTVAVDFPDDYGAEALAGRSATFAVSVKDVREKILPALDNDLASDAAGFDTLEELRADLREKLLEADRRAVDAEFRHAALDAAVANAKVDVPDALVAARAQELWEQMASSLERQGLAKDAYLRIAGKSEEEVVEEAKPDAAQGLRREAVLAAIIDAEGIEPSEEDLLQALEHSAEHEETTPEKLLARLRDADRLGPLQEDIATRRAVDLIASTAQPITVEQAKARDKPWTPEKDEGDAASAAAGRLWTPGS